MVQNDKVHLPKKSLLECHKVHTWPTSFHLVSGLTSDPGGLTIFSMRGIVVCLATTTMYYKMKKLQSVLQVNPKTGRSTVVGGEGGGWWLGEGGNWNSH